MVAILDGDCGYGEFGNASEMVEVMDCDSDKRMDYIKKLWQEDPKRYYEWKNLCIEGGFLPEVFGTSDNPIPIDESKL